MMTRKRRRLTFVTVGMVCVALAAILVSSALREDLVFYKTPTDIATNPPSTRQALRIGGLVEDNSVTRSEDGMRVEFRVTDGKHDMPVAYVGVLPSLFREGQGVVAEGKLDATGEFQASTVLAKHDERYMPKEVVDALKASGQWRGDSPEASASAAPALPTQVSQKP